MTAFALWTFAIGCALGAVWLRLRRGRRSRSEQLPGDGLRSALPMASAQTIEPPTPLALPDGSDEARVAREVGAPVTLAVREATVLPPARSLRWCGPLDLLLIRGDTSFAALDVTAGRIVFRAGAHGTMSTTDTFDPRTGPIHTWTFTWWPPLPPDRWWRGWLASRRGDGSPLAADAVASALGSELEPWSTSRLHHLTPPPLPERGPGGEWTAAAALPGGRTAAIDGGRIVLREAPTGEVGVTVVEGRMQVGPLPGREIPWDAAARVEASEVSWSADGRRAVHVCDGELRIWGPAGGRRIALEDGAAFTARFLDDDRLLVASAHAGVWIARVEDGSVQRLPTAGTVVGIATSDAGMVVVGLDGVAAFDPRGEPLGGAAIPGAEEASGVGGQWLVRTREGRVVRWAPGAEPVDVGRGEALGDGGVVIEADTLRTADPTGAPSWRIPVDRRIVAARREGDALYAVARGRDGESDTLLAIRRGGVSGVAVPTGERHAISAAAGAVAIGTGRGVALADLATGQTLVTRHDLAGRAAGIETAGAAVDGWGEVAPALVATCGPVTLPIGPTLAAAWSPGLLRSRRAALRGAWLPPRD